MTDTTTPSMDEEFEKWAGEPVPNTDSKITEQERHILYQWAAWQAATDNMQSKVSELEAENDRLRKQVEKNISSALKHNEQVRELEAKIAELQKDLAENELLKHKLRLFLDSPSSLEAPESIVKELESYLKRAE